MQRVARILSAVLVLALALAGCAGRQGGHPKDELVLCRLGNSVGVMFNGQLVQKVEVRGDFRFDAEIPFKADGGHGEMLRYFGDGAQKILGVGGLRSYWQQSPCDMARVVRCSTVDYLGVQVLYSISLFEDTAEIVIPIISSEQHVLAVYYYERFVQTPAKDSPEFDSYCNALLARALTTFKVDVDALRRHFAPVKPQA